MKQLSTILSSVALILVIVLFILYFKDRNQPKQVSKVAVSDTSYNFKIAYFDIDSLQQHYLYYKDAFEQLKSKESQMSAELTNLENSYQKRIREWQQKGANMTQAEGEAAQKEFGQMQERYQRRKIELEQELEKRKIDLMGDLRNKLEDFLKEYNKDRKFAYILSNEPGLIFYRDSAYDITPDVLKGLNADYKAKEKK